jgi:hypothetical protein
MKYLRSLIKSLEGLDTSATLAALRANDRVQVWERSIVPENVLNTINNLPDEIQVVLFSVVAAGQAHILVTRDELLPSDWLVRFEQLQDALTIVHSFYASMGGIIGYQLKALELIHGDDRTGEITKEYFAPDSKISTRDPPKSKISREQISINNSSEGQYGLSKVIIRCLIPRGPNLDPAFQPAPDTSSRISDPSNRTLKSHALLTKSSNPKINSLFVQRLLVREAISALPFTAEIWPVGGAGDRLGLVDEVTGEALPTAMLEFCGRPLLETLIRDLEAREYLAWHLTGEQHTTPVVLMTSHAKNNHSRIRAFLEENDWMGRGPQNFMLIDQPMVPLVDSEQGMWLRDAEGNAFQPLLKPGGHGALWKLMLDRNAFTWLESSHRRSIALVRQISNPAAGTDATLLTLAGAGVNGKKAFGFASCARVEGATEGINVLVERREMTSAGGDGKSIISASYGVSNIEYTEFARYGLPGNPVEYPANTNILYVDIRRVRTAVESEPAASMPGMIFNKSKQVISGGKKVAAGRIETTMQNVADFLTNRFDDVLDEEVHFEGFVV